MPPNFGEVWVPKVIIWENRLYFVFWSNRLYLGNVLALRDPQDFAKMATFYSDRIRKHVRRFGAPARISVSDLRDSKNPVKTP